MTGLAGRIFRLAGIMLLAVASATAAAQRAPGVAAPAPTSGAVIQVPVRGQVLVPLSAIPSRLAIGDPIVADMQLLEPSQGRPGAILIVGNRPGSTDLQVWHAGAAAPQRWQVQVLDEIRQALADKGQGPQAEVIAGSDRAVIAGASASLLEQRKAVESGRAAVGDEGIVDFSTVTTSSMVQVEVRVVEVSRNVMKAAGIDWSAGRGVGRGATGRTWGGAASLRPASIVGEGFSLLYSSADFIASLAMLEGNGMARILAEPTLVAMSGQSASFLAGGEIPVPMAGALGTQTVEYKPFGIGLTVTPTVLSPSRIALKVAPEASDIDDSYIMGGPNALAMPMLRTRRADTTIELGDGESFVISGLVMRQTRAKVQKFPFLGELPIIGAFFRSVEYSQDERELVIVVTPRLVRPFARDAVIPLPGARQEQINTAGNAWGHYLLGPDLVGHQMPGFSR